MTNDFLFELGCEELPSAAVLGLSETLSDMIQSSLEKLELSYRSLKTFATPRRLAILITDLAMEQPKQKQIKRGPHQAAAYNEKHEPTKALLGFAKSCGVGLDALTTIQTEKGEWVVYEAEMKGMSASSLLPSMIKETLSNLPLKKPMRWGSGDEVFARPIHWAVMLLGQEILACELFGVKAGRTTYGHRFHAPQAITINQPSEYEKRLHDAFVMVDFAKRKEIIQNQLEKKASEHQAKLVFDADLLNEVTSIVEWPEVLQATFDKTFLTVPPEVLIAAMQTHQKCFALRDAKDHLLPYFLTVSNIQSTNPKQVIEGNEKVMRARLSDAAFFFDQDKKHSLSHHIADTAKVLFQAKLGTLLDKATRIQSLMTYLMDTLHLNKLQALRAAELCKCDLMTGMVGEFPELQGLMGYYYALNDGEDTEVAMALQEQYLPRFSGDLLPQAPLGLALSLADRLDTLVGIFGIGQKPTGVKDPFKCRRHALAVVRLLIASPYTLNLTTLIEKTMTSYGTAFKDDTSLVQELKTFLFERLQSYYFAQGIPHDRVTAVRACQQDYLDDFDKRIQALQVFTKLPEAVVLSAVCKRVNNLLQQDIHQGAIDDHLLQEDAEKSLYDKLQTMKRTIKPLKEKQDYRLLLTELTGLRPTVDAFFDQVMVMVDDPQLKQNRLKLLSHLQALLQDVADISQLQLS